MIERESEITSPGPSPEAFHFTESLRNDNPEITSTSALNTKKRVLGEYPVSRATTWHTNFGAAAGDSKAGSKRDIPDLKCGRREGQSVNRFHSREILPVEVASASPEE